ncbi:hypothetical protein PRIPAC_94323, partial [Pristionchus pacificus]|uniref:Uncharacterized protein n=1 Tax=Pristionchus pacificus TaxID=54126 RepID=A0A2A6BAI9_PRIPA
MRERPGSRKCLECLPLPRSETERVDSERWLTSSTSGSFPRSLLHREFVSSCCTQRLPLSLFPPSTLESSDLCFIKCIARNSIVTGSFDDKYKITNLFQSNCQILYRNSD